MSQTTWIRTGSYVPRPKRYRKYRWGEMKVGESEFFPGQTANCHNGKASAVNAAYQYGRRHGKEFRAVTTRDGVLIQRTK